MEHDNVADENSPTGLPSLDNEAPIWSILPSYDMYASTIFKSVNVSNEGPEPPMYEHSSISSADSNPFSSNSNTTATTSVAGGRGLDGERLILADQSSSLWQETILDNTHRLKNLTDTRNTVSNGVKLEVFFTKEVGDFGKKLEIIDPTLHEYKQGDLLNGYVVIANETNDEIPFDMFNVLLEGNFIVSNTKNAADKRPVVIKKFLEIFDFSASWTEAYVNRLLEDKLEQYFCPYQHDPIDGTLISMRGRLLLPKETYKRFFNFKIPESLLDSQCNEHNLSSHVELPPTLGLSKYEAPLNLNTHMKDFSFVDSSVSYDVLARFIGRKSAYNVDEDLRDIDRTKLVNNSGDEYVILKERRNYIRVVKESKRFTENEKLMKLTENRVLYDMFMRSLDQKIESGNQLVKFINEGNVGEIIDGSTRLAEAELQIEKAKQCYRRGPYRDIKQQSFKENIEVVHPINKSNILGLVKQLGCVRIQVPKVDHIVKYIPPPRFRRTEKVIESPRLLDVQIDFSIDLPFQNKKGPELRLISCDLVVFTFKSNGDQIPIELNHDLLYKNECIPQLEYVGDSDNFTQHTKLPVRSKSLEIGKLLTKLGHQNYKLESQFVRDMKAICKMDENYMNLELTDILIQANGNEYENNQRSLSAIRSISTCSSKPGNKRFNLIVNLDSAKLKGDNKKHTVPSYDRFCLLPSFQSCFMGRFYYLRVTFHLSNNTIVNVKVPVTIQK
ncbi:uncharacterized protein PRCAT00000135001 [Priceomyces carsonii]|uniref:uncharacterized protein n=1 Tax=Priceomyces carsonii TaxID=28549 RepID=UPI002ED89DDD|nr:unnamed protein product [Priceomyces carsonii]